MVKNWQLIFVLFVIVLIAFILRAFFAYDYAVGGGFALSGGSSASIHLRAIEHIMTNWSQLTNDPGLNYPFGDHNTNPFLMDWILAVIAKVVTLFGVSTSAAAAGTLVFATAILGALTCIPIYYLGRDMFNHTAGVTAALLYAICAVVISNTVLSNGTEAAFYGFFFVLMVYYLYKALKACTNDTFVREKGKTSTYVRSVYTKNRHALKYALIAGVMLACVALTWNGFRPVVLMLSAIMLIQVILDRIRKKDSTAVASLYSVTLLVGMFIAAPFYLFQGLWGMVFSGPFMLSIIVVIVTAVISETKNRPWLVVIPVVAVIMILFFLILFFVSPGAFSDIVSGNAIYTDPTYASLAVRNSIVSLSQMAAYYGWLTVWMPYALAALMIYALREKMNSPTHTFILMWIVAMLAISWTSRANVFLAAPAYAVGGGALLARIFRRADVKEYFSSFKGTGFQIKAGLKKIAKPIPLFTVLMAVFLVGVPNAVYAIDSSMSSNQNASSNGGNYFGAFNYFVRNDDSWKANDAWQSMANEPKSGALVTWWDYGNDAALMGGFDVVTGSSGAGAAAASNIMLADGSKEATAAMAIRIMDYYGIEAFRDAFVNSSAPFMTDPQFNYLESIFDNPSSFISEIMRNPGRYGSFSSSLTPENAMYIMAIDYLCSTPAANAPSPAAANAPLGLSETQIIDLYDSVCGISGNSINYIAVSPAMFPIGYGDNSMFSTLAYMNNYALDSNGAPSQFYYYDSSGYCVYNDNMYNSVLWRTYIGPSPSDYGYSSAIQMLNAFTLSNGEPNTYPQPGFGMPNYQVVYWKVLYNPDPKATNDSDGWVTMDALEARALQMQVSDPSQRGLINYFAGYPIILEYMPSNGADKVTGQVVLNGTTDGIEGARIALFDQDGLQRATVFTDENGDFELYAPYKDASGNADWTIKVSLGSTTRTGGIQMEREYTPADLPGPLTIEVTPISLEFRLFEDKTYDNQIDDSTLTATITGAAHIKDPVELKMDPSDGVFRVWDSTLSVFKTAELIPDTYTVTIKDSSGTTLFTGTYNPTIDWITQGDIVKADMFLSSATINLNVSNEFGAPLTSDPTSDPPTAPSGLYEKYIKLTNVDDPTYYRIVQLDNGTGTTDVIPGTYVATVVAWDGSDPATNVSDPNYELFNSFVTVAANGTQTLTATAQRYATIDITYPAMTALTEVTILNSAISITLDVSGSAPASAKAPAGLAGNTYTVYALYTDATGVRKFSYNTVNVTQGGSAAVSLPAGSDVFTFSRTLVSSLDGTSVVGTVDIYVKDASDQYNLLMTLGAGSDGSISTWLPAGTYMVHAYNTTASNRLAFIGELTTVGTDTGGVIRLERAQALTAKVLMSNVGSAAFSFAPIVINDSTTGLSFNVTTDSTGSYSKFVPMSGNYTFMTYRTFSSSSTGATFEIANDDSSYVNLTYVRGLTLTTTTTVTVTFRTLTPTLGGYIYFLDQNGDPVQTEGLIAGVSNIIEIKQSTQADTQYVGYNTDPSNGRLLDPVTGLPLQLPIGNYTVRVQRDTVTAAGATVPTGYYYSGTFTVTSDQAKVTVNVEKMNRLELTGLASDDVVTVTKLDGGDSIAGTGTTAGHENIWYFEAGKTFQVQVTNATGDKIWYYYVTGDGFDATGILIGTVAPASNTREDPKSPLSSGNPDIPGLFGTRVAVELEDSVEIKGYVGYAGTGNLYISYGQVGPYVPSTPSSPSSPSYMHAVNPNYITDDPQTYVATISAGKYTAVLPKALAGTSLQDHMYFFAAFLGYDNDSGEYTYTNMPGYPTGTLGDPTRIVNTGDDLPDPNYGVVNMTVVGEPAAVTPADVPLTISSEDWTLIDFNDGVYTVEITLENITGNAVSGSDNFRSLFLSGGAGWDSIKFVDPTTGKEISFVNLSSTPVSVRVEATFSDGVDGSQLTIIFTDASGTTVQTYTVVGSDSAIPAPGTGALTEDPTNDVVIGRGESDRIANSESSVSITLRNNTLSAKYFQIDVFSRESFPDILNYDPGWYYVISDSTGNILSRDGPDRYTFEIDPMTEVTVFVTIIGMTENSPVLPDKFDVSVTVFEDAAATTEWNTVAPRGENAKAGPADNEVIVTLEPQPVSLVSGGGSASGPNVFGDGGSTPSILWVMLALMMLVLVLIVWLGMKRGVFTRRK